MPGMRRLVSALFSASLIAGAALAQTIAIKAGSLIDPETGKAVRDQVILVDKGIITRVGADVPIPAGAQVVDLSNRSVLPGLFDCHSHLCLGITSPKELPEPDLILNYTVNTSQSTRALTAVRNCREYLMAGFTTVRDVGNSGRYVDVDVMRAVEAGWFLGPTIIPSGPIIAPYGGQFKLHPDRAELGEPEYIYADTPDEMVKAIRKNAHFGAKVIKIVIDDQPYIYSVDDVKRIVKEAADAGLKVCAHSLTNRGAEVAAKGGVASIEHGWQMSDATLRIAKDNGVVLVGTDFTERAVKAYGLPDSVAKSIHDNLVDRIKRAVKTGVTLAFGSDLIFWIPEMTRGEMALTIADSYLEAGMTPAACLRAMIPEAAKLLGVASQRGAIRPGQAADIIACAGDPLADLQALKNVDFVMKDGKIVKGGK